MFLNVPMFTEIDTCYVDDRLDYNPSLPGDLPTTSGVAWGQQMRRSLLSPHTFSLTWLMIFLFFSMSDVSLARLSWEMMGAHVLIGIHSLSIGQEEIESRKHVYKLQLGSCKEAFYPIPSNVLAI